MRIMPDNSNRLFLTTTPGILTGIASVIVAVTGLYIALHPNPNPNPISNQTSPGKEAPPRTKPSSPLEWPLIAEETFTGENSGWSIGSFSYDSAPRFEHRVVDGKYRWDVDFKGANHGWVISPYASAVNFSVAVDARFVSIANPMTASLVFGSTDDEQYEFQLSSSGSYYLFKYYLKETRYKGLINGSTSKLYPAESNRMRVVVDEQLIRYYLNNELVGQYRAIEFTGGNVGLAVGAGSAQGGAGVIDFDNFEFRRKPE